MTEEVKMSIPVDNDGFVRRECPQCEKQFKWQMSEDAEGTIDQPAYFCPYCGGEAAADSWWTKEQLKYAEELLLAEVVQPKVDEFALDINRGGQNSAFFNIEVSAGSSKTPEPLTEPNDMKITHSHCHASELVKIQNDWKDTIYCSICGAKSV